MLRHLNCLVLAAIASVSAAHAQQVTRDIPYATAHPRQVLDVHAPACSRRQGFPPRSSPAARPRTRVSNDNIGAANDPVTAKLFAFVAQALKR